MKITNWKSRNTIIALIIYWFLISVNAHLSNIYELPHLTEWWINTIVFLSIVLLCILTFTTTLKLFYRLLILPASWLVHAVLTAFAAQVLGIIMYNANHIRTNGEHRAVFILASLPILIFLMKRSKLFVDVLFIDKPDKQ